MSVSVWAATHGDRVPDIPWFQYTVVLLLLTRGEGTANARTEHVLEELVQVKKRVIEAGNRHRSESKSVG